MDFFKKLFGGGKNKDENFDSARDSFVCENCGEERLLSQKKDYGAREEEKPKNVCEFC